MKITKVAQNFKSRRLMELYKTLSKKIQETGLSDEQYDKAYENGSLSYYVEPSLLLQIEELGGLIHEEELNAKDKPTFYREPTLNPKKPMPTLASVVTASHKEKAKALFDLLLSFGPSHDEAMVILNALFGMLQSHPDLPSRIRQDFRTAKVK